MRFDNGPEFIAHAVADWCRFNGVDTVFIDPGSPWQNAWIEIVQRSRSATSCSTAERFDSLLEAKVVIEDWRIDYNNNRPHCAHGDPHPNRVRPSLDQPETTNQHSHNEWTTNRGQVNSCQQLAPGTAASRPRNRSPVQRVLPRSPGR